MLAFNDVKVYKEKLSALICEMWESRKTRFTKANNLWPCLYFLLLRSDLSLKQYYCHHQEVSLLESQEKEEALKQLSSVSKYGWVHRGGHQWALLLSNSCYRLLCLGTFYHENWYIRIHSFRDNSFIHSFSLPIMKTRTVAFHFCETKFWETILIQVSC